MTNQLIGLGLIILVVAGYGWWLWSTRHRGGVAAKESGGVQVFDITVKGVYSPAVIEAELGRPVKINFTRQESTDCSRFVNFPDFKIRRELPEGETVTIELTPTKPGEFIFTCDMSMYQGKLIIK